MTEKKKTVPFPQICFGVFEERQEKNQRNKKREGKITELQLLIRISFLGIDHGQFNVRQYLGSLSESWMSVVFEIVRIFCKCFPFRMQLSQRDAYLSLKYEPTVYLKYKLKYLHLHTQL